VLPHHHGHEAASARRARAVSERLKAPTECRDLAEMVAREHGILARADELRAETMVRLIERCDGLRRPERFALMLAAAACDQAGRGARGDNAPAARPLARWHAALAAVRSDDAGTIAQNCKDKALSPQTLHAARVAAVKALDKETP
jgi:tRNA nucleotidyltransferase (CCA-adding enzyme)